MYYMASSVSGQDESNPVLWLATRAGKMGLSCPLGTTCLVLRENFPWKPYNKFFIDQASLVKMAGYWTWSFFASLWTLTPSWSINSQKKNLANIQPSWPHNWSITHIAEPVSKQSKQFHQIFQESFLTGHPCSLTATFVWLHNGQDQDV